GGGPPSMGLSPVMTSGRAVTAWSADEVVASAAQGAREGAGERVAVGAERRRDAGADLAREAARGRQRRAVGEDLLRRRQLADRDGRDVVREPSRGTRVDLRVVLAVVADQEPVDVGQLAEEAFERGVLVLGAAAEPPGVRRAPVRQQERAGREAV